MRHSPLAGPEPRKQVSLGSAEPEGGRRRGELVGLLPVDDAYGAARVANRVEIRWPANDHELGDGRIPAGTSGQRHASQVMPSSPVRRNGQPGSSTPRHGPASRCSTRPPGGQLPGQHRASRGPRSWDRDGTGLSSISRQRPAPTDTRVARPPEQTSCGSISYHRPARRRGHS
jgi:hypothetical protein